MQLGPVKLLHVQVVMEIVRTLQMAEDVPMRYMSQIMMGRLLLF